MTLAKLHKMKQAGEKIVCLTAYEASQAYWAVEAGVEVILVGDSLGMVVQGHQNTLPVSLNDMVYHTQMVQRKNHQAWCIADIPFMSDMDLSSVLGAAARLMKEGQANMVKLEGGQRVVEMVESLSRLGVPVCGHLGLLPQSVQKKGYQVAGKETESATKLLEEAKMLESAGADMLVLECVPAPLANQITDNLAIPVIGIGAGHETDGQVLVLHDVLGLTIGKAPKFSKNFLSEADSIQAALSQYVSDVKSSRFPASEHCVG
ncbi:MAG: 3-methyl-2-oxobutanoate hydroxymethyltransferase [Thiomicrospira sp.]|nr:MAG: 3-methyl-2-oxobutanoate hydroxymethyltransferase [Thiomicrospira sp.]